MNKFRSYSFYVSLSATIVLVLNNIGKIFGFVIDADLVSKIVDGVCEILILFGVITMTKKDNVEKIEQNDNNDNQETTEEQDKKN